ncbi:enoyl-CoA hydratase/isomerase family protein [Rhodovulum adriaticum]|uniref:Enoyl-CoA hydratase n=1 Tax=Rhodovulum adriaticum TaxID=35804 RepID=A0A4R2NIJ1_RHOAD|nr:enoyl-CoA hydratase/isomerase family protein [Rhodovulum adriaticum]MBK1635386.1 crotonase [Rhodovulum adriaticum]TCP21092.1 enoyl-CoA hydratase [Rhodovulum adriaticum]
MAYETIQCETHGPVGVIRFNRPHRLNAVVTELYTETLAALDAMATDDAIRTIVLTGTGRAFCVGADLKEHAAQARSDLEKLDYLTLGNTVCERLQSHPKPVIAAVNGYALGAGAEMACACDFILMAQGAQIGFPEVSIGTHLGGGITGTLPRLVGLTMARELIFTGRRIDGEEAVRLGLANRAFDDERFWDDALGFAAGIATKAPYSMRFAKALLNDGRMEHGARLAAELSALRTCMLTEDWAEGITAFAEKRQPQFRGK